MKNLTTSKKTELNAYTITWAILTPINGKKITKKDCSVIYKSGIYSVGASKKENEIIAHFSSKENAIKAIKKVNGLTKQYRAVFITDKQFGLAKWNQPKIEVATKLQLINEIIIG